MMSRFYHDVERKVFESFIFMGFFFSKWKGSPEKWVLISISS